MSESEIQLADPRDLLKELEIILRKLRASHPSDYYVIANNHLEYEFARRFYVAIAKMEETVGYFKTFIVEDTN